jgi:hypothetical protein
VNPLRPPAHWARAERAAYAVGLLFLMAFAAAFVLEFLVGY